MGTIEVELRSPAPRPARLRPGARRRFASALVLFVLLGGLPLLRVTRQIHAFEALQRDGLPVSGTVLRQDERVYPAGVRIDTLECVYAIPAGRTETAAVRVPHGWWLASPPGSRVILTVSPDLPGFAAMGDPTTLQLGEELGLDGSGWLILGLTALLVFGACLRPGFRDLALVSLGCPVPGRVVGRTCKVVRRCGRKVTLRMIHLQFRDPYGVERVRTQFVDKRRWDQVGEGEPMTVLVCARRRGWFAAYPLLRAEAIPPCPAVRTAAEAKRG